MTRHRNALPSAVQIELLKYLNTYLRKYRYSPSVREIQKSQKYSSSSVALYHLRMLQSRNLIRRTPKTARTIRVTRLGHQLLRASIPSTIIKRAQGTGIATPQPVPLLALSVTSGLDR